LHCYSDGRDPSIISEHFAKYIELIDLPASVKLIINSFLPDLRSLNLFIMTACSDVSNNKFPSQTEMRRKASRGKDEQWHREVGGLKQNIEKAVQNNGLDLQFASDDLKNDVDVVCAAILQNPKSLDYASTRLQLDEGIIVYTAKTIANRVLLSTNPNLLSQSVKQISLIRKGLKRLVVPDAIALREKALELALRTSGAMLVVLPEGIKEKQVNILDAVEYHSSDYGPNFSYRSFWQAGFAAIPIEAYGSAIVLKKLLPDGLGRFPFEKCTAEIFEDIEMRALLGQRFVKDGMAGAFNIPFETITSKEFLRSFVSCLTSRNISNIYNLYRRSFVHVAEKGLSLDSLSPLIHFVFTEFPYSKSKTSCVCLSCHSEILRLLYVCLHEEFGGPSNSNTLYNVVFKAYHNMFVQSSGDDKNEKRSLSLLLRFAQFGVSHNFRPVFWTDILDDYRGEHARFIERSGILSVPVVKAEQMWQLWSRVEQRNQQDHEVVREIKHRRLE